jgi:hypothetical protein
MEKLKYAQDLIKASSTSAACGFNTFISGGNKPKSHEYGDKREWYERLRGYEYAEKMAKEGGIAFTKPFKCGESYDCYPFEYGGFFVCNSCGNKSVDKDWWKIKVEKDGNAYCCHSLGFEPNHITEDGFNNFAFGDTFEEAIKNYGVLMAQV